MWRIEDGEASEGAKGICTMCFNARLCRHAALVRLALLVSDQRAGTTFGPCASPTLAYIIGEACEQTSVASGACWRVL